MVALLEVPKIAMFRALYHHHGLSKGLCRVSRIRSAHSEAVNCENLDELQAVVRSSYHTMLIVEWSPALVAGLTVEERGRWNGGARRGTSRRRNGRRGR